MVAVFALGLAGAPVVAYASPFASYRSGAADQYQSSNGTQSGDNGNSNSNNTASNSRNGTGAKVQKHKSLRAHHHASGVNGQSTSGNSSIAGANVRVAPSTVPIKTHGTLPFTGLSLTLLVLVALGLLGGGLAFRAAERLHRRRRADAAS